MCKYHIYDINISNSHAKVISIHKIVIDGKERILSSDDIVITDGKKPVCIAGIMGGENTEVDENTKNILIESAIFDPVVTRYTAKRLDLNPRFNKWRK